MYEEDQKQGTKEKKEIVDHIYLVLTNQRFLEAHLKINLLVQVLRSFLYDFICLTTALICIIKLADKRFGTDD